jgi:hypothetical protein
MKGICSFPIFTHDLKIHWLILFWEKYFNLFTGFDITMFFYTLIDIF